VKIKKILSFFLTMILLLNLCRCDSHTLNLEDKTLIFSQSNQQFSIVSFYLTMSTYIEAAKVNKKNIDRIYKRYVYNPIWKDFASKGECSFLAKFLTNPITDLEGLNTEIKILSQSGVEEIVKEALKMISKMLPGPNTTVYLQVNDPTNKKYFPKNLQIGVVAHTFGTGRIYIAIDPTVPGWKKQLPKIIAHEYHHSFWISRNFKTINFSLLEYLLLEGRAESFADLLYPDIDSPWINIFGFEKEQQVWYKIKDVLHRRDGQLNLRIAVGDKDIPFASAYTMGYRIMQAFFKNNPQVTLLDWTNMGAEEILLKSKYEEKIN